MKLIYMDGITDQGLVTLGERTSLTNGASIVLKPLEDGTVRVVLNSAISASGDFNEDLLPGRLIDNIDITYAELLGVLEADDLLRVLSNIEVQSTGMTASSIVNNPTAYCDGQIYRIPGKVT